MSYFNRKQFIIFLAIFAVIRLFSFWFTPDTPLWGASWLNEFTALAYTLFTAYCLIKKYSLGWYLVAGEIILGGGGGYFSVWGISLRTLLFATSIIIYAAQNIKQKLKIGNWKLEIWVLFIIAILSSIIGFFNDHSVKNILPDLIPYGFLLYYFPLKKLLIDKKFKQVAFNLIVAAIVGNFLLITITFIGYSSGLLILQDYFYHWYRDAAGGKITALPFNFYRLVLNEQLLLAPLLLWCFYNLIAKISQKWLWITLATILLILLSINLTRIYILAIIIGALTLVSKNNWKEWLKYFIGGTLIFVIGFTAIHFSASRGQSLGWELFGLRLQSIASPTIEDSALSRILLLPKILEKIKNAPIFGTGLGDTITVYSPIFKQQITTPHFDWGYLEIWAEMGLVGLLAWGLFIGKIIKNNLKKPLALSMLTALLVINLTSPALFHVLGIILLVILFLISISETKNIYQVPINLNLTTSVNNNSIAHVGDLINSIDYDAPEGTPVYAASDGVVIDVKNDSNTGGLEKKYENDGNYIEILHDNDEISEYEHLRQNSAKVKIGDRVNSGDIIAEVGNTGWSECPHLHFMVYPKGEEYKTKKILFNQ